MGTVPDRTKAVERGGVKARGVTVRSATSQAFLKFKTDL
jgi:hypothetical protein